MLTNCPSLMISRRGLLHDCEIFANLRLTITTRHGADGAGGGAVPGDRGARRQAQRRHQPGGDPGPAVPRRHGGAGQQGGGHGNNKQR